MIEELTNREKKLILFLRKMGWGETKIKIENGQPTLIYEAIRTLRLEEKDDKKGQKNVKPIK